MGTKIPKSSVFESVVLSRVYRNDPYFDKLKNANRNIASYQTSPKHSGLNPIETKVLDDSPKRWWHTSKLMLFQYFEYSSMHGLKFIAQRQRHLSERIFWLISFIVSALTAAYLISKIWVRYNENPVVVSFDSGDVNIEDIPFPALTICNMNKISKDVINKLVVRAEKNGSSNLANTARMRLQYVQSMCNDAMTFSKINGFSSKRGDVDTTKYRYNGSTMDNGVYSFLAEWTTPCDELIRACIWSGKKRNCSELFKTSFTALGKCCSFNRIPPQLLYRKEISEWFKVNLASRVSKKERYREKELKSWRQWNYTNGFVKSANEIRPRVQHQAGAPYGLSILLDPQVNRYFCTTSESQGFRFRLHTPVDAPQMTKYGMAIGLNREMFIEVTPTITMADPDLHSFKYERRKCLFTHERKLKFFRIYTEKNCFMECVSEILRKNCSCSAYNLVKAPKTPICSTDRSSKEHRCYLRVTKKIDSRIRRFCPLCVKSCVGISYGIKSMFSNLQNSSKLWFDHSDELTRPPDWAGNQMSILHIYFRQDTFVPRIRREMYGTVDLIANTGNLVTLCLGFSILSAFEILYFCTVRVFWNKMRKFYEAAFADCNRKKMDPGPVKSIHTPGITVEPYTGSFRHKLQTVSLCDAPSSFYMINELYNPAHFLRASHMKQQ